MNGNRRSARGISMSVSLHQLVQLLQIFQNYFVIGSNVQSSQVDRLGFCEFFVEVQDSTEIHLRNYLLFNTNKISRKPDRWFSILFCEDWTSNALTITRLLILSA